MKKPFRFPSRICRWAIAAHCSLFTAHCDSPGPPGTVKCPARRIHSIRCFAWLIHLDRLLAAIDASRRRQCHVDVRISGDRLAED
jgi:hypothetical protein